MSNRFNIPSAASVINCQPSQTNWLARGGGSGSSNSYQTPQQQQPNSFQQQEAQQLQQNQQVYQAQQQASYSQPSEPYGQPQGERPKAEWVATRALFPKSDGSCSLCGSYASIKEVAGKQKPGMAYWKCTECPNKYGNGGGKMGNEHPVSGYQPPTSSQQPQSLPQQQPLPGQQNGGGGNQGAVSAQSLDVGLLMDEVRNVRGELELVARDVCAIQDSIGQLSVQLFTTLDQHEKVIKGLALRPAEKIVPLPRKRQRAIAPPSPPPVLSPSDEEEEEGQI